MPKQTFPRPNSRHTERKIRDWRSISNWNPETDESGNRHSFQASVQCGHVTEFLGFRNQEFRTGGFFQRMHMSSLKGAEPSRRASVFVCFDFLPLPQHSQIGTRPRARIIVSSFSSQWWTYPRWSSDSCFGLFTQPALSLLGAARFQKKPGITMTMDPLKGIGTRPT